MARLLQAVEEAVVPLARQARTAVTVALAPIGVLADAAAASFASPITAVARYLARGAEVATGLAYICWPAAVARLVCAAVLAAARRSRQSARLAQLAAGGAAASRAGDGVGRREADPDEEEREHRGGRARREGLSQVVQDELP